MTPKEIDELRDKCIEELQKLALGGSKRSQKILEKFKRQKKMLVVSRKFGRSFCGATTKNGNPCRHTSLLDNGRCKAHGGKDDCAQESYYREMQE